MEKNFKNEEWTEAAAAAMKWYGWGSPVGLTIFFIGLGITAILIRFAFKGF